MCASEVKNFSPTSTYLEQHQTETKNPNPNYDLHIFDFSCLLFSEL